MTMCKCIVLYPSVAVAIVLGVKALAPAAEPGAAAAPPDVKIELVALEEVRRARFSQQPESQFDRPRLVLTYDLAIPDGLQVHAVNQPRDVEAVDSAGKDLSALEPGFRGERSYVELIQQWNESPTGYTFRLLPSSRSATTFDLKADFDIVVYGGTDSFSFEPTDDWQPIDGSLLGSDKVQAKLDEGGFGPDTTMVSLRPGTVRDAIHEVYLIDGDQEIKSMGAMWSDQSASFSFNHPRAAEGKGQRVRIIVRTDVQSIPITIDLSEQELP